MEEKNDDKKKALQFTKSNENPLTDSNPDTYFKSGIPTFIKKKSHVGMIYGIFYLN